MHCIIWRKCQTIAYIGLQGESNIGKKEQILFVSCKKLKKNVACCLICLFLSCLMITIGLYEQQTMFLKFDSVMTNVVFWWPFCFLAKNAEDYYKNLELLAWKLSELCSIYFLAAAILLLKKKMAEGHYEQPCKIWSF